MTPGRVRRASAPVAEAIEARVLLSTYLVTNTDDSGAGSLRQAILDANAHSGGDSISFNIPGTGVHTIQPQTALPDITDPVGLAGESQPGYQRNTATLGDNEVVAIEIDGRMINSPVLHLTPGASDSSIIGLCVNHGGVLLDHLNHADLFEDFLGTDTTGKTVPAPTGTALDVEGGQNIQIGVFPATGVPISNIIAGGSQYGIRLNGVPGTTVYRNLIGVGADGVTALGNGIGVSIQTVSSESGFLTQVSSNVIGGSTQIGLQLTGSATTSPTNPSTAHVFGNLIGVGADGHTAVPNRIGVELQNEQSDTIGSSTAGQQNVISGNSAAPGDTDPLGGAGVVVVSSVDARIQYNRIGTDATGGAAVPNSGPGIAISRDSHFLVSNNVISGNGGDGIDAGLFGDFPTRPIGGAAILSNNIGRDITGVLPLGNHGSGVVVGTLGTAVENNQISANGRYGVDATGRKQGPYGSLGIVNNVIGSRTASSTLGNAGDGVRVENGSTAVGVSGNTIAFNGGNGVTVGNSPTDTSSGVKINTNSVFSNHGLGIDLGNDGVTPNTPGSPHTGPNQLQSTPVIDWARIYPNSLRVSGTIDSTPNTPFTIEFYRSASPNISGNVEGQFFESSVSITTDAAGHARFASLRVGGPLITATATGPDGTSEFSAPATATLSAADLDGNGTVGFSDLLILAQWYGTPGTPQQGDIDLNGIVGFPDLLLLAQTYGRTTSMTAAAAAIAAPAQPDADGSVRKGARLTRLLMRQKGRRLTALVARLA